MKITKSQLKQIIKEELTSTLSEGDGSNSSATMKDGTTIPMDSRAERRRTRGRASREVKRFFDRSPEAQSDWVDNNMTNLGYEFKLERMISPDPEKKLYPEDLKASVLMKFPDGEERKYNSETGPEGERFY
jgi:hypothetical protein